MVNALQMVREFKEAGDEVTLICDGGGVTALAAMVQADHRLHSLYQRIEDKVAGACAYCSKAFHVREHLEAAQVPFLADYKQHPSLRSLVAEGYEVITL